MSPLPSTMKAPLPELNEGEVLVKNVFAGINFVDIYYRTGVYPSKSLPDIIGNEAAGAIVAIREPNPLGFKIGDRVAWTGRGAYAEYTAVNHATCVIIPSEVPDRDAASVLLMGMTALSLVKKAYAVQKGQTVLVHAAAGGVGLLMCQILKDIGAIVIGTAGSPEKCALAKEHGAMHVIDYRGSSGAGWMEQVKEITNGQGVDVVYDSVGKDTWEGSMDVAKRNGKVVFTGVASGPIPDTLMQRVAEKNVSVMRSSLKNMIATRPEFEFYATSVLDHLKNGKIKVKIHGIYSLSNVPRAHEELEGRNTTGKLLVKL
ncbi:hypothetical protein V501_02598 [Pseudogymnoascus sp. VKM F-4519 (FW-2642)]|nr:hypothetical protein V501_02598 [Pseudogymnoascus sp. VKM F-4519 (FW-2642)]